MQEGHVFKSLHKEIFMVSTCFGKTKYPWLAYQISQMYLLRLSQNKCHKWFTVNPKDKYSLLFYVIIVTGALNPVVECRSFNTVGDLVAHYKSFPLGLVCLMFPKRLRS